MNNIATPTRSKLQREAKALALAHRFNGTQQMLDAFVQVADPLEKAKTLSFDEVQSLLSISTRAYYNRLAKANSSHSLVPESNFVHTQLAFVPPNFDLAPAHSLTRNGTGAWEAPRLEPRLNKVLAYLHQHHGIHADQVIVHAGTTRKGWMRQEPYYIIEVPDLANAQLAVCNQVGNALFVSHTPLSVYDWATNFKNTLAALPSVTRIEWHEATWAEELAQALRGVVKPNATATYKSVQAQARHHRTQKPDISMAFLVHECVAFYREHGRFPHGRDGPLKNYPGENWRNIEANSINQGFREFKKQFKNGIIPFKGIGGMLRSRQGKQLVEQKLGTIPAELQCLPDIVTLDMLVQECVIFYREHGRFPHVRDGPLKNYPGENWGNIENNIINQGKRRFKKQFKNRVVPFTGISSMLRSPWGGEALNRLSTQSFTNDETGQQQPYAPLISEIMDRMARGNLFRHQAPRVPAPK